MGIGNIGWSELLVIGVIVLVFFGPRRLPEIANAVGRSLREFRKALNEVRTEISQAGNVPEPSIRPPLTPTGRPGTRPDPEPEPGAGEPTTNAAGPRPDPEPGAGEPPATEPRSAGQRAEGHDGDAGDPEPEAS